MKKLTLILSIALASSVSYAEEAKKEEAKTAEPKKDEPKKDEAKPAEPAPTDASAEIKAGTGVEKREIVGEATSFTAGTTVWVWSRIKNGEPAVKHVWKRDGKDVWTATLKIGGKNWSTQSRRTIPKAGKWEVDVQTSDGTSLGTVAFDVQ